MTADTSGDADCTAGSRDQTHGDFRELKETSSRCYDPVGECRNLYTGTDAGAVDVNLGIRIEVREQHARAPCGATQVSLGRIRDLAEFGKISPSTERRTVSSENEGCQ